MDLATLEQLLTAVGQEALRAATALAPDDATFLAAHRRLSKRYPADLTRAALETALLRRRAVGKFSRADRMYFTREALEQASSEPVARHRARRFAGRGPIADLCCGIGGDALALAAVAPVVAVDLDPVRLRMAGLNAAAYDVADRVRLVEGDALQVDLTGVAAVFADPHRRVDGRRVVSMADARPSLAELMARLPRDLPLAVKLAPGLPSAEVAALPGEVEFIALDGELKECVLWAGAFRQTARRATLLPTGATLTADVLPLAPPPGPPRAWLHDIDAAVVRAGLTGELARLLNAHPLDAAVACLTGDAAHDTPFTRRYAIEAVLPVDRRRIQEYLRTHGVGRIQVRRIGASLDVAELERRLKLTGDSFRTLVLTPVDGRAQAIVCEAVAFG
ncbi:MAG: class I SAM-dependent methyltransferase [Gemmataceae bacterium]